MSLRRIVLLSMLTLFTSAAAIGAWALPLQDECKECRHKWHDNGGGVLIPECQGPCDSNSDCDDLLIPAGDWRCICISTVQGGTDWYPACNCESVAFLVGGAWNVDCTQVAACSVPGEDCDENTPSHLVEACQCK